MIQMTNSETLFQMVKRLVDTMDLHSVALMVLMLTSKTEKRWDLNMVSTKTGSTVEMMVEKRDYTTELM